MLVLAICSDLGGCFITNFIGFFIMLSFSVTVVYAQELVPSKIGTMAGLTVGLAFGMGAIGAVVIGILMDHWCLYNHDYCFHVANHRTSSIRIT